MTSAGPDVLRLKVLAAHGAEGTGVDELLSATASSSYLRPETPSSTGMTLSRSCSTT